MTKSNLIAVAIISSVFIFTINAFGQIGGKARKGNRQRPLIIHTSPIDAEIRQNGRLKELSGNRNPTTKGLTKVGAGTLPLTIRGRRRRS